MSSRSVRGSGRTFDSCGNQRIHQTAKGGKGYRQVATAARFEVEGLERRMLLASAIAAFQTRQVFFSGSNPYSVAMADMNGDGKLDLVTANSNGNTVSVLLGNGNGTFQFPRTFATGAHPLWVTVADVNGDAKPDVLVTNYTDSSISVLLGNGNGTLQSQQTFAVAHARQFAISDVNGDGRPDLAVAESGARGVGVLFGNGNGTFLPQQTFYTNGADAIAVGDVNGDGKPDLVTSSGFRSVGVSLGNGNGTFQATQFFAAGTTAVVEGIVVVDVNHDGKADIVTANESPSVSVLLGNGNGEFQSPQTYAAGSGFTDFLSVADLNLDGNPDILFPDSSDDTVVVMLGNGNGTFQAQQSFLAGLLGGPVGVGDVNGDGRPDLAVSLGGLNEVSVLLGDTPPVLQSITRSTPPGPNTTGNANFTVTFSEPVIGVDPTDFTVPTTGGITDTGVSVSGSGAVYTVHINGVAGLGTLGLNLVDDGSIKDALGNPLQPGGVAAFQSQQTAAAGSAPRHVAVADINGDGKPDIVAADYYYYNGGIIPISDGEVAVLLSNGNATFKSPNIFLSDFAAPTGVTVADFNNDGRLDVAETISRGVVEVLLGNGDGTLQNPHSFAAGSGPSSLSAADLNGDGKPDLVVSNENDNSVSVLLGNGNGTFQPQKTFAAGSLPLSVAVADFNRDGKPDIAVANYTSNTVSVLLGNGNGTFGGQQTFADPGAPASLAVSDVNRDGAVDLVTANFIGKGVGVLLGNGNGTFQAVQTLAAGSAPNSVAVADVNGDGQPDVVVNHGSGYDSISVLLGNGNGTFQSQQSFAGGNLSTGLAVADLNGDGRQDVAIANFGFFGYSLSNVSILLGSSNANLTGPTYTVIPSPAVVTSINRTSPAGPLTNAASVTYTVTFSVAVSNVLPSDFQIISNSAVGWTAPAVISGTGSSYSVTINGIHGSGTLELALIDHDTIVDSFGTPIGGAGVGNASFFGQVYTILQTGPKVVSINRSSPVGPNTSGSSVGFAVTFNTAVTGVDPTHFTVFASGTASFTPPLLVSGSLSSYTVTVNGISGSGTLGLNLVDDGAIRDAIGNPLQGNPVSFLPQRTFAVGNSNPSTDPRQIAIGDVNGDGIPDLVATTAKFAYNNRVDVLLGNGNGTYLPNQSFAAGNFPYAVAIADVNGDGNADILVGSSGSSGGILCVLLGNGNGTFLAQRTFAGGNSENSMTVADLNADGKLDVITANQNGQSVSVFMGNGNGTFAAQQTFATGMFPIGVTAADVNGDGKLDLVVANEYHLANSVSVLLGNGNGTFLPAHFAAGSYPDATAIGDVNGDGKPDLIVANYHAASVSVLLGNGNGTFAAQQTFAVGSNPNAVVLADMNGDGLLDIVVLNRLSNNAGILLGNGNGTFQPQRVFATGGLPDGLAVGDLNGDGKPDLTAVGFYSGAGVLIANSGGNFTGQAYNILLNLDTITGTAAVDQISLVQDTDAQHIDWTLNGTTSGQMLINDPNGLTINGGGSNDVITLTYPSGANPLPNTLHLSGTFTFNNLTGANPFAGTTFEIGKSTVFITYAGPTSDPILAIKSYIQSGYNGGAWNGAATATSGVITSVPARTNTGYMIGYADASDGVVSGQPANTVELKYTLGGDLNLAGTVVFSDFALVVANYGKPASWDGGAITYGNTVSFADFALTVANYGKQTVTSVSLAASTVTATTLSPNGSGSGGSTQGVPTIQTTGPVDSVVYPQPRPKVAMKKRR